MKNFGNFFEKMSSFWQLVDIQMAIFRRVRMTMFKILSLHIDIFLYIYVGYQESLLTANFSFTCQCQSRVCVFMDFFSRVKWKLSNQKAGNGHIFDKNIHHRCIVQTYIVFGKIYWLHVKYCKLSFTVLQKI